MRSELIKAAYIDRLRKESSTLIPLAVAAPELGKQLKQMLVNGYPVVQSALGKSYPAVEKGLNTIRKKTPKFVKSIGSSVMDTAISLGHNFL